MEDRRQNYVSYVANVMSVLKDRNYPDVKIAEIVKNIDRVYNNIDYHFPRKGWKYLIKHYTPEIKRGENVIFEMLGDMSYMCVYDKENDEYTVTFTFINMKDVVESDYKKYLIYNYFKNKYTYRNIKASSYKNAVVIAHNHNINDFPKIHRIKMYMELWFSDCRWRTPFKDNIDVTNPLPAKDTVYKTPYQSYKRVREHLMSTENLQDKDIRFYNMDEYFGIIVVRRSETEYDVAFSFVSPVDRFYLHNLNNSGDIKHISRYWLIHNFEANTYRYKILDCGNSMDAAAKAFNDNRLKFPSYYHDNKLEVFIRKNIFKKF